MRVGGGFELPPSLHAGGPLAVADGSASGIMAQAAQWQCTEVPSEPPTERSVTAALQADTTPPPQSPPVFVCTVIVYAAGHKSDSRLHAPDCI